MTKSFALGGGVCEKDAEIYNFCLFGQLTPPSVENLNLSTSIHRLPLSFDILKSQSEVLPINVTQNAIDQLNLDWRVIGLNVSYQVTVASLQINEEGELRSAQTEAVKAEKEAGGEPPSLGKLKRLNA